MFIREKDHDRRPLRRLGMLMTHAPLPRFHIGRVTLPLAPKRELRNEGVSFA